jgi:hypothetical protein
VLEGRLQQEGREIAYLEHHNFYFPWSKFKRNRVNSIRWAGHAAYTIKIKFYKSVDGKLEGKNPSKRPRVDWMIL